MTYTIKSDEKVKINLAPKTLFEEIIQNLTMILSTIKNTTPLERDFGLSARFIDKPTPAAEALLTAEVLDAVEKYEPRAQIVDIFFERDEIAGKITPRLEVEIYDD